MKNIYFIICVKFSPEIQDKIGPPHKKQRFHYINTNLMIVTYIDCDQSGNIAGQFTTHQQVADQFSGVLTFLSGCFEKEFRKTWPIDRHLTEMGTHCHILYGCIDFNLNLTPYFVFAMLCHIKPFLGNFCCLSIAYRKWINRLLFFFHLFCKRQSDKHSSMSISV